MEADTFGAPHAASSLKVPKQKLDESLSMTRYFQVAVTPAKMLLYRPLSGNTVLNEEGFRVDAGDWSTIVLDDDEPLTSFEVVLVSCKDWRVGWVSPKFTKETQFSYKGVGDEIDTWALDQRGGAWNGGVKCQTDSPWTWKQGDIISSSLDIDASKMFWEVNG